LHKAGQIAEDVGCADERGGLREGAALHAPRILA
jgi:hypothetical protein